MFVFVFNVKSHLPLAYSRSIDLNYVLSVSHLFNIKVNRHVVTHISDFGI